MLKTTGTKGVIGRLSIAVLGATLALGCAATARQTAREAAPAAMEAGLKKADQPSTRDRVASLLADPEIRKSTSALSESVANGVLESLAQRENQGRVQQATQGVVASTGPAVAGVMRRDIAPALADSIGQVAERSLDRALDARTEERLQAMVVAMTRSTLQGLTQGLLDERGRATPVLAQSMGELARGVTREAALGFQDAVRESRRNGNADGNVLAVAGESAEVALGAARFLSWAPLAVGLVLLATLAALLTAALVRLRHHKRQSREREEAALAVARAIKSAENARWATELREHLRATTADTEGGEALRKLLGEHAELRLVPREPAPPPSVAHH